jgi:hypothetical protein
LAQSVFALRKGEFERALPLLDFSQSQVDEQTFFRTLAVGYRGFPDMKMLSRARLPYGTVYVFDYEGAPGERIVRALVVTSANRVRPVTDAEPALGLVQWGWRGWHRAGRSTAGNPPAGDRVLPVQPGHGVSVAIREGWRGAFPLDRPVKAPTPPIEAVQRALQAYEAGDDATFLAQFTPASRARIEAGMAENQEEFDARRPNSTWDARADLQIELGPAGWVVVYSRPDGQGGRVVHWQYVARSKTGPKLANFVSLESLEYIARSGGLLDRLLEPPAGATPTPAPPVKP